MLFNEPHPLLAYKRTASSVHCRDRYTLTPLPPSHDAPEMVTPPPDQCDTAAVGAGATTLTAASGRTAVKDMRTKLVNFFMEQVPFDWKCSSAPFAAAPTLPSVRYCNMSGNRPVSSDKVSRELDECALNQAYWPGPCQDAHVKRLTTPHRGCPKGEEMNRGLVAVQKPPKQADRTVWSLSTATHVH